MKIIYAVLAMSLLSGCGMLTWKPPEPLPPKIITVKEVVPIDIYQPPMPPGVELLDVNWFVITEENIDEQIAKIERMLGGEFVVFALVPDGYQKMAENLQEIRRYMRQQRELIIYYREATSTGDTAEEWLEANEDKTNGQEEPSEEVHGSSTSSSNTPGQDEVQP